MLAIFTIIGIGFATIGHIDCQLDGVKGDDCVATIAQDVVYEYPNPSDY